MYRVFTPSLMHFCQRSFEHDQHERQPVIPSQRAVQAPEVPDHPAEARCPGKGQFPHKTAIAHAKTIRVSLTQREHSVVLQIQDDGRGFGDARISSGKKVRRVTGLTNKRERAAALGGTCELVSAPKRGTTIPVRVPITEAK